VVEPACEVNTVLDDVNEKKDLVARPAADESAADHQRRHDSVASNRAYGRIARRWRNLSESPTNKFPSAFNHVT